MSKDFEITKMQFSKTAINNIENKYFVSENWPIVFENKIRLLPTFNG